MPDQGIPPSYPPSLLTVLLPVRYHLRRSWFRLDFVFSVSGWFPAGATISSPCHDRFRFAVLWGSDSCRRSPRQQASPLTAYHLLTVPPPTKNAPRHRFVRPVQRDGWVSGFAVRSQARRNIPPNRVRQPTDRPFASGCSPPRLAATQLPSATEFWHTPTRTSTVLVMRHHGRTSALPPRASPRSSSFWGHDAKTFACRLRRSQIRKKVRSSPSQRLTTLTVSAKSRAQLPHYKNNVPGNPPDLCPQGESHQGPCVRRDAGAEDHAPV